MKSRTRSHALPDSVAGLTPLELNRKISVIEAASYNGVHVDTFKKNFPHLIKRVGKRLLMVTVLDAITLPPATTEKEPT